jgi:hypothetical protein
LAEAAGAGGAAPFGEPAGPPAAGSEVAEVAPSDEATAPAPGVGIAPSGETAAAALSGEAAALPGEAAAGAMSGGAAALSSEAGRAALSGEAGALSGGAATGVVSSGTVPVCALPFGDGAAPFWASVVWSGRASSPAGRS